VATFIPKSHTPFQWDSQISVAESRRRIQWLQNQLRRPGISFKWQHPHVSRLEGLWARGDRRLSRLLVAAYQRGCQFDGWSDHFDYHQWLAACRDAQVDIDFYTARRRDKSEPLPWDHIDSRVEKKFLWEESIKARAGQPTADCRKGDCNLCGVCDFKSIAPRVFDVCRSADGSPTGNGPSEETIWRKYKIIFSKTDQARFFGHLEMVNLFSRAINRAGITVKYSKGFHPKPKLSFKDALPVGLESRYEILHITAADDIAGAEILKRLNLQLPQGLVVEECRLADDGPPAELNNFTTYQIYLPAGAFNAEALKGFCQLSEHIVTKTNRKGKVKKVDLRAAVVNIDVVTDSKMEMILQSSSGKIVRPNGTLKEIFTLTDAQLKSARIIKIRTRTESTPAAK
jgi:radical SAM-linked protein